MDGTDNRIISDARSRIIICTMRHVLGSKKKSSKCPPGSRFSAAFSREMWKRSCTCRNANALFIISRPHVMCRWEDERLKLATCLNKKHKFVTNRPEYYQLPSNHSDKSATISTVNNTSHFVKPLLPCVHNKGRFGDGVMVAQTLLSCGGNATS
jgi:hypothetical protein